MYPQRLFFFLSGFLCVFPGHYFGNWQRWGKFEQSKRGNYSPQCSLHLPQPLHIWWPVRKRRLMDVWGAPLAAHLAPAVWGQGAFWDGGAVKAVASLTSACCNFLPHSDALQLSSLPRFCLCLFKWPWLVFHTQLMPSHTSYTAYMCWLFKIRNTPSHLISAFLFNHHCTSTHHFWDF